jgi:hypothetical protein
MHQQENNLSVASQTLMLFNAKEHFKQKNVSIICQQEA